MITITPALVFLTKNLSHHHHHHHQDKTKIESITHILLNDSKIECHTISPYNYTNDYLDKILFYKHFISGWLTLFVIFFGILANSVTICALMHSYMRKSSTNAYLLSLSISNIFSLICLLMMVGLRFTLVYPYREVYCLHWYERFINLSMPYLTPINNLFQLSGIYLTTAVSIDRYVLITKRVKESIYRKRRQKVTKLIIFCIFCFCTIYTLPNWFLYKSETRHFDTRELISYNKTGKEPTFIRTYVQTRKTSFGDNQITKYVLQAYLYIPFVFAIPVCILLIVNFLIIYKLIGITARKRQLGTITSIDRSITIMLVSIVLVFLVCQVPLMIVNILSTINPDIHLNASYAIINSIANFLLCINLSVNFALYCFFGEAFRNTIQYMFCIRDDLPKGSKQPMSMHIIHRESSILAHFLHSIIGTKKFTVNDERANYALLSKKRASLPTPSAKRNKFLSVDMSATKNIPLNRYRKTFVGKIEENNSSDCNKPNHGTQLLSIASNVKSHNSLNNSDLLKNEKRRFSENISCQSNHV